MLNACLGANSAKLPGPFDRVPMASGFSADALNGLVPVLPWLETGTPWSERSDGTRAAPADDAMRYRLLVN